MLKTVFYKISDLRFIINLFQNRKHYWLFENNVIDKDHLIEIFSDLKLFGYIKHLYIKFNFAVGIISCLSD